MYCPYWTAGLSPKVVVTLHVDDRLVTWPGLLAADQSLTSDLSAGTWSGLATFTLQSCINIPFSLLLRTNYF